PRREARPRAYAARARPGSPDPDPRPASARNPVRPPVWLAPAAGHNTTRSSRRPPPRSSRSPASAKDNKPRAAPARNGIGVTDHGTGSADAASAIHDEYLARHVVRLDQIQHRSRDVGRLAQSPEGRRPHQMRGIILTPIRGQQY